MVITTWHDLTSGRDAIRGPAALAIGTFDGVHRGHREILQRLSGCRTRVVLTFRQHPRSVLAREHPGTLTTLRQRQERFAALGVTHLVLIDFSEQFSRLLGREFIAALRRVMALRKLVVGVDFRCGRGRDTDVVELQRLLAPAGVPVAVVPPVMAAGYAVSSTRIRAAVLAGDFAAAQEMMGRPFEIDLRTAAATRHAAVPVAAEQLEQILPPPGTYAASVTTAAGSTVAAVVEVAAAGVRWAWPAAMPSAPLTLRFHRRVDPRRDRRTTSTGEVRNVGSRP